MIASGKRFLSSVISLLLLFCSSACWALSSSNIPLDSPIYSYLEKLSGFGAIRSDVKGIRPFSKAEAARLVLEAERAFSSADAPYPALASDLIVKLRELLPREISLYSSTGKKPPFFDFNPLSYQRFRYVYLDGVARSYERPVHDPGGDGVFGIGGGLRPDNPYPTVAQQHGSEGTPLLENNNGVTFRNGSNFELRWSAEAYLSDVATGLVEPAVVKHKGYSRFNINRSYVKFGGGSLELEVGKDENWLGQGFRGNITLTNNAENFTQVKLSSPEPFRIKWFSWLGDLKYSLIASRFDTTNTEGVERRPWFYSLKLIAKPIEDLELGFNLGRQVGGPGVNNSASDSIRGLIGGTNADNSNGLAGFEFRYRMPWLRNTELFAEYSGEDTAGFWPIVESYVAGIYIPCLTADGRNDLRFEFFHGNQILYTNSTFPEGYIYKGLPIGHFLGGATEDFFFRYSHWFSTRNNVAIEYFHTERGNLGRVPATDGKFDPNGAFQAVERTNAGRIVWRLPLYGDVDFNLMYGCERIHNMNLVGGENRTNQLLKVDLSYRY